MPSLIGRRRLLQTLGAALALAPGSARAAQGHPASWRMPVEAADTPKICLGFYMPVEDANIRKVKQIGVDYVLMGGPRIPWDESEIRTRIERFKAGGLTLYNMMISGFDDVIFGRPGADAQIEQVIASIRAAGRAGLPVIEYNFYANRLIEGYKEEKGRAGAGYTAYDYELSKTLPPKDGVGTPLACGSVEAGRALSQSRRPGSREGERPARAAPERPTGAAQPRLRAADGHGRSLEAVPESGEEPVQRDDLRLRRDPRDG
jgi:mannonate dehydratase